MITPEMTVKTRRIVVRLGILLALVALVVLLRATLFAPKPLAVRVVTVERGTVEETVTNSRAGTIKARRRAKLSPEIGGRIAELPHKEGERVHAGELLLRIDDVLQRASLEVAERDVTATAAQRDQACLTADRAKRELERNEGLAAQGIVSTDLLDQVTSTARTTEAACKAAVAALERARSNAGLARAQVVKTELRAPFDGVLAEISTQVGEWTTPSPPGLPIPSVIDLIDTSSLYVSAPMDEVDSARIHAGQKARVTIDSYPGRSFPATVVRVAPYVLDVEAQNRTVEIEAELQDAEFSKKLLPGTSADVEAILSTHPDVLRIPTTALLEGGKVLVLQGDRLVERTLKLGVRNWDWSEVREGLTAGERVVTSLDRADVKAGARARAEDSGRP
jgi:HlyD family secretion protein